MAIASVNPATGETVKTFEAFDPGRVEGVLARAFEQAKERTDRTAGLRKAADLLDQRKDELAGLMTLEMGKPIKQARAEIEKCAWVCRHYAEHAAGYLAPERIESDAKHSEVRFQPLGVVLAVMPWNFPYCQVFGFAAPAIAAGNVGVLKHASSVPQCALAIESVLQGAGLPFHTLLVEAKRIAKLVEDPRIAAATLTGSDGAGRSLGEAAGRNLKKLVLELGGSDPFIVLPSADLDKAVQVAVTARNQNAGQSCIAAKRFILHERIAGAFEQKFVAAVSKLKVGDPRDENTEVGPLASEQGLLDIDKQVKQAIEQGARKACGGERIGQKGFFYAPTVLLQAEKTVVWTDETFGPVAAVVRAKDIDHAIALANDTRFGLGAAAFTTDAADIARLTDRLQAGSVFINGMVKSDPRLPFGGIKESGYGRELSREGIREFVNVKTVWVA